MKTRTLLLLALGCAIAIMVAGVALLFQLRGQEEAAADIVAIGDQVQVGDMIVVVDAVEHAGRELTVEIRIGGVDDPDGADGFRLVVAGESAPVRPLEREGDCGATAIAEQSCSLHFDLAGSEDRSLVLLFGRGDERVRWTLP